MTRRASNCSEVLRAKSGQPAAPGTSSVNCESMGATLPRAIPTGIVTYAVSDYCALITSPLFSWHRVFPDPIGHGIALPGPTANNRPALARYPLNGDR